MRVERLARVDRDADPDARAGGEERVGERADQAAHDERAGQGVDAARAEVVGAVVGAGEVEDVLGEREADADHAGVDDAVEDAVELGTPPPQQEQEEQALAGLLGDRRADLEHPRVGDAADEAADALDQQRDGGRDEHAPQQTADEQAARLGLVAVEPQAARDQRPDRDRGQQRGQDRRPAVRWRHPRPGSSARRTRSTSAVTTIVKTALPRRGTGHGGSLAKWSIPLRMPERRGRRLASVSEQTETKPETAPDHELHTESHDPSVPEAYSAFMRQGWGDRELDLPPHPIAPYAAARRQRLAEAFPGERLVLPAGTFKVRSNDTDYRFRPDTAHTYFCGNQTSDAVLVVEDGEAVLYARPRS